MTAGGSAGYPPSMRFYAVIICCLGVLSSCSSVVPAVGGTSDSKVEFLKDPRSRLHLEHDTILLISPNPAKGFNFGYFLRVPRDIRPSNPVLYVEPNGKIDSNDLAAQEQAARKIVESGYSLRLAQRLKSPMLVPIFYSLGTGIYVQALNRKALKVHEGPLKRVDLQLMAMIEDARKLLERSGVKVTPKVFMNGFSASGVFTIRFTALHPELVQASSAGGINALPMLPMPKLENYPLNYPLGINNFEGVTGKKLNLDAYLHAPQKMYMGELDVNDTVPFGDSWDEDEAALIRHVFGEKMMPDRWAKTQEILESTGADVDLKTYASVGHKVPAVIEEEIYQFLEAHR